MKVVSSQADFLVTDNGTIQQITWKLGHCLITHKFLSTITKFDTDKFRRQHKELPDEINITFVGYWINNKYIRSIF